MHKPNAKIILKTVVNAKNDSEIRYSFPLVCKARWDESIDVYHIAIWSIFTPLYSFEKISVFNQKFENKFKIHKKLSISL